MGIQVQAGEGAEPWVRLGQSRPGRPMQQEYQISPVPVGLGNEVTEAKGGQEKWKATDSGHTTAAQQECNNDSRTVSHGDGEGITPQQGGGHHGCHGYGLGQDTYLGAATLQLDPGIMDAPGLHPPWLASGECVSGTNKAAHHSANRARQWERERS